MADFVEEPFTIVSTGNQHKLACIFHRKHSPFIDAQQREHVIVICHGYLSHKNALFLPQISRDISTDNTINQFHSVRFDFHGCGESTGREDWDYGGYENEVKDDLRSVINYLRSDNHARKYFVRALVGHSRGGTNILLYAAHFDDVPILVNIAGRYRLERGINERFSERERSEIEKQGFILVHNRERDEFRVTREGIERRRKIDMSQIERIRQARVLSIAGDQDDIIDPEDVYLFYQQMKETKKNEMIIVPDADHCFKGKEKELIDIIRPWIGQMLNSMDTHNIVGSTSAIGDDNNNNNNNISTTKPIHTSDNGTTPSSYEGNYQVDISSTNFELESITSSYTGLMRIYRLLYVADHCPALRNDALLASLKYIQETHFISLYKQVLAELTKQNVPLPNDFDAGWYERTQRNYVHKLEKLDTDLRNFRTNSIKDSIRRGHDDLGDHYLDSGDYFNAVRCYVRSRDYCVTPRHMITMCMNVIKASFHMQNWSNVLSYVSKAEQALESLESATKSTTTPATMSTTINPMETATTPTGTSAGQDAILFSRLKVYAGIAELATKRYKLAARHFLAVSFDHCSNNFQDLISPQTLIQYVCLCSLATFERSELHRQILMSTNMKQYLELEPSIRDILHKFYETSYSSCLALMTQMEPIFALDQYLASHLRTLFYEIRHRIIITYFLPYKNASMTIMARQLNTTLVELEDELVYLIRSGKIKARIDSKNKILYVADTDQRWHAYQHALTITHQSEKITRALLLRSAIIKANLSVKDDTTSPNNNNNEFRNLTRRQHQYAPTTAGMMDEGELSDDGAM